jgi:hypothetical protein
MERSEGPDGRQAFLVTFGGAGHPGDCQKKLAGGGAKPRVSKHTAIGWKPEHQTNTAPGFHPGYPVVGQAPTHKSRCARRTLRIAEPGAHPEQKTAYPTWEHAAEDQASQASLKTAGSPPG